MKLLAIDTTGPHCAAALLDGQDVLVSQTEAMRTGQAERLFPMLADVLQNAGCVWSDVAALAVATGPGNFTGVRIGVAAARGLALSLGIGCRGVSLFEALAFGHAGAVIALCDARRSMLYAQEFRGGVATSAPKLIGREELLRELAPDTRLIGFEAEALATTCGRVSIKGSSHPSPALIGLAAQRAGPAEEVAAPLYIRSPDASPSTDPAPRVLR